MVLRLIGYEVIIVRRVSLFVLRLTFWRNIGPPDINLDRMSYGNALISHVMNRQHFFPER
jgi:hypothetical protein